MSEELLDDGLTTDPPIEKVKKEYKPLIKWWESKRLRYNLIVGGIGTLIFFMMLGLDMTTPRHTLNDTWSAFKMFGQMTLLCFLSYNFLYMIGWLVDVLIKFLFNKELPEQVKVIFYRFLIFLSIVPFLILLFFAFAYLNHFLS